MSFRPASHFRPSADVDGFRSVLVNYFFVQPIPGSSQWVLVDAGLPGCGANLIRRAEERFTLRPPSALVLTHGHFDHVGALRTVMRRWPDTPVYAHPAELPFLNERVPYPAPDPSVGGGWLARSAPLFPQRVKALPAAVKPLPGDGAIPAMPGWRWVHTPGHTPGHVSLWRESDRFMLSGDAVITTRQESVRAVWSQVPEVRPPPAYFTPDWQAAFESLVRVRDLEPKILAGGHGLPLAGEALRRGLDLLVEQFPSRGLPRQGRYVPATPPSVFSLPRGA